MLSLDKSIELYKLMANRCGSSKFTQNQAKVYREMTDFISNCDDLEDSMQKIKNSEYYLAPSIALVKDKIEAWKRAAIENDMPELVEVYEDKLNKIENDPQEIYVAGYEQTAQSIKNDYLNTMQAFTDIFNSYISYLCTSENTHLEGIEMHLSKLKKPSNKFKELADNVKFRNLLPISDKSYKDFVDFIENFLNGNLDKSFWIFESETNSQWEEVQQSKKEIKQMGKSHSVSLLYSECNVEAPKIHDVQKYTYKDTGDC